MERKTQNILLIINRPHIKPSSYLLNHIPALKEIGLKKIAAPEGLKNDEWVACLKEHGISFETIERGRLTPKTAVDIAAKENIDIIAGLYNPDEHCPVYRLILKIINTGRIPVLLLNEKEISQGNGKDIFSSVLYAAGRSAKLNGPPQFLINLQSQIKTLDIVCVVSKKLTIRDMRAMRQKLTEMRDVCRLNNINAECHIYAGTTWEEIVTAAADYKAKLILLSEDIAGKGINGIIQKNLMLRKAMKSPLPVLIAPCRARAGSV